MRIRINVNIKVGRLVKYFVLSDLLLFAGWGAIEPIFSIFVIQKVAGATIVTVGAAAAIYWLLKSVLQLPIANFLDRTDGEKDDFYALILGLLIAAFSAVSFALVSKIWQLFLVQIVHAMGLALYSASWPTIFSRHLDKDRISFDWALDSTAVGVSAGVSGFLGGVLASWFGFESVFILAGILSVAAALALLLVPEVVLPRAKTPAKISPLAKEKPPMAVGR